MAISSTTNERFFLDAVAIADRIRAVAAACDAYKERAYAMGIPNRAETPVAGFEDANGLTTTDIDKAISLAIEPGDWHTAGRKTNVQTILRNEPAQ
jgi:hypothetical protein